MNTLSRYELWLLATSQTVLVLTGILSLAPTGCSDDSGQDESEKYQSTDIGNGDSDTRKPEWSSCDPFVKDEVTIALGILYGVGRDAEGIIYVADESEGDDTEDRIFVSSGETLYRKDIRGGSSNLDNGVRRRSISFMTNNDTENALLIETDETESDEAGVTAIAIVRGNPGEELASETYEEIPLSELGETGDMLEVLDESVVSNMAVRNLPNTITTLYFAKAENSGIILVTRPENDWSEENFEIFYGEADLLTERSIIKVEEEGCAGWRFLFDLDGVQADVSFDSTDSNNDTGERITNWTLTIADEIFAMSPIEDEENGIAACSFNCIVD